MHGMYFKCITVFILKFCILNECYDLEIKLVKNFYLKWWNEGDMYNIWLFVISPSWEKCTLIGENYCNKITLNLFVSDLYVYFEKKFIWLIIKLVFLVFFF